MSITFTIIKGDFFFLLKETKKGEQQEQGTEIEQGGEVERTRQDQSEAGSFRGKWVGWNHTVRAQN